MKHDLQEKLLAQAVRLLQDRGLVLKKGTTVDSMLISVPSSTRNTGKRSGIRRYIP